MSDTPTRKSIMSSTSESYCELAASYDKNGTHNMTGTDGM